MDEFDAERIVARVQGRRGWLREARRQLEAEALADRRRRSRARASERLRRRRAAPGGRSGRRIRAATRPMRRSGQHRRMHDRRRLGRPAEALHAARDPGRRGERDRPGLAADEGQPPLHPGLQRPGGRQRAADRARGGDHHRRRRLLTPTTDDRQPRSTSSRQAGVDRPPAVVVADAQYWNEQHMDDVTAEHGLQVLIPPDSGKRKGAAARLDRRALLIHAHVLADRSRARDSTANARQSIEPVFGHTKHNRKFTRFHRRGRSPVQDRVAADDDDPQPHQAPPPPARHRLTPASRQRPLGASSLAPSRSPRPTQDRLSDSLAT